MTYDRNFDGISGKFANNIYGTTKGRLRHELLIHHLEANNVLVDLKSKRVIDVGCGLGHMCQSLSVFGATPLGIDISEESIKQNQQNPSLNNCNFRVASFMDISETYDLVVCHAMLEWVKNPIATLDKIRDLCATHGVISLSFFSEEAHRYTNMVYGNFDYVARGLKTKSKVKLNPQAPVSYHRVLKWLDGQKDLELLQTAGIRCVHDNMRHLDQQEDKYAELLAAEKKYGVLEPYKFLGRYFHIIVRKKN